MQTDKLKQSFTKTIATWRINRERYPGWWILPQSNRLALWRNTKQWIPFFHHLEKQLRPEEKLSLLYELTWRIGKCLFPLSADLAEAIASTLESVNPFPSIIPARPEMTLSEGNATSFDWQYLQMSWIELALELLRYHREQHHKSEFHLLASNLGKIEHLSGALYNVIKYHSCLLYLSEGNHSSVEDVLRNWKSNAGDPYCQVWRASIYVELGDLERAKETATAALLDIRQRIRMDTPDVAMLSREGWAMLLMAGLTYEPFVRSSIAEYRGRWEWLATYRCNANIELEIFEEKLAHTPPKRTAFAQTITEEIAFDLGKLRVSGNVSFQTPDEQYIAVQCIRMLEEAGYPPKAGNINLSAKRYSQAATWLDAEESPFSIVGVLFRTLDVRLLDRFYSRYRIASFAIDVVSELQRIAETAIGEAMTILRSSLVVDKLDKARERLKIGLELFSRLMVRAPLHLSNFYLDKALTLYNDTLIQSGKYGRELENLFSRALELMTAHDQSARLVDLFGLPIPISGITVKEVENWPEPAYLVSTPLVRDSVDKARLQSVVTTLLEIVESEETEARNRSIIRLIVLFENGLLDTHQTAEFARVLWKYLDSFGFPKSNLYKAEFLKFPELEVGASARKFREYILGSAPSRWTTVNFTPEGKKQVTIQVSAYTTWFDEINRGSSRFSESSEVSKKIVWTSEEVVRIFSKIVDWWEYEGKDLLNDPPSIMMPPSALQDRLDAIVSCLGLVLLPQLDPTSPFVTRANDFVWSLYAAKVLVVPALPALLKTCPMDYDRVVGIVRSSLISSNRKDIGAALESVLAWLECSRALGVKPPPGALIDEVANIVASRRQPGLGHALDKSRKLLENFSDSLSEHFRESLAFGLKALLQVLKYNSNSTPQEIDVEQIPLLRLLSLRLAVALQRKFPSFDGISEHWKAEAKKDPLPEMRLEVAVKP